MNVLGIADVSRQAVIYLAQFIYLFTGVFSTCVAQFIYYEGAGGKYMNRYCRRTPKY